MGKTKWFHPKRESGWSKDLSAKSRRSLVYRNTDKQLNPYERNLRAERQMLALANVSQDKLTTNLAYLDASYFKKRRLALKYKGGHVRRLKKSKRNI